MTSSLILFLFFVAALIGFVVYLLIWRIPPDHKTVDLQLRASIDQLLSNVNLSPDVAIDRLLEIQVDPRTARKQGAFLLGGALFQEIWLQRNYQSAALERESAKLDGIQWLRKKLESQIDIILKKGNQSEHIVSGWLDELCNQISNEDVCKIWRPKDSGINEVVFPPSDGLNVSSELDDLLLTEYGVFIVETKGWSNIQDDGRQVINGETVSSPHEQTQAKLRRLKHIVGPGVYVGGLYVLPKLRTTPLKLTSDYVTSPSELSLWFRKIRQASLRKPENSKTLRREFSVIQQKITTSLDSQPKSKLRHMIWLAKQANPPKEALNIVELIKSIGNPPDKPKDREVEFSKKEVLREEVEIYRQPDHGCLEAC